MSFSKEKIIHALPFCLILGLAFFLRFYQIDQFQFDSDELSAIFRAQNAHTWNQHIQNGILIDGHPAGVQTLLWFWIKLFSNNPLPLKVFTAIIGLINVVLVFAISRKLFNQKSAIFAMLCMATLWWQVDLSLWVRPYIFGQLFTLLSLNVLNLEKKDTPLSGSEWILLSIYISAAFYIHYFAFLSVGLLCLSIFILHPSKRIQLLKSAGLFFLMAIPQMSIVLHQLKVGGLDWLGKPNLNFFYNHLLYNFNQSESLFFAILIFVAVGIYFIQKLKSSQNFGIATLMFTLWILPIIIGYAYSIYSKPVLQNNVLFFTAPMLIVGLSYFYQRIPKYLFAFSIIFVGSVSVIQIFKLKHRFDVEINDIYASQIKTLNDSLNSRNFNFIDGPIDVFQFHQNKINSRLNLLNHRSLWNISAHDFTFKVFHRQLKSLKGKSNLFFFSNAGSKPELRPLLYYYFPNSKIHSQYIGGQIDEFNLSPLADTNYLQKFNKDFVNAFPLTLANQTSIPANLNYTFSFSSDHFGKYIVDQMNFIEKEIQPNDLLVIKIENNQRYNDAKIVTALINKKKSIFSNQETQDQIDFRYTQCSDFWNEGFSAAFHVLKLSDIPNWNSQTDLRITVETKNKTIKNIPISIYRFHGNPYQYGIN